jgi:hypothetical protein
MKVADGSFYCVRGERSAAPVVTDDTSWVVRAAPDAEGDAEIFFYDGSDVVQITDNSYDDTAPHYDAESHSIVWQGLVNDRYQIFSHDITLRETEQLTRSTVNNMEPSRHGDITVWQQWVGSNWEIMLLREGESASQITNNTYHDLLPDVQDGYVIWNSQATAGNPQVMMYELQSGTRATIEDTDGGQVINPRFVLVYDTEFANGDLVTKGFDPETGSVITLAAQPADELPDIPDSDQTGETRALIQNKSPNSREDDIDATPSPVPIDTDGEATEAQSTTTPHQVQNEQVSDIDIASSSDTILPLTDYDLIVEPAAATSSEPTVATSSESVRATATSVRQ